MYRIGIALAVTLIIAMIAVAGGQKVDCDQIRRDAEKAAWDHFRVEFATQKYGLTPPEYGKLHHELFVEYKAKLAVIEANWKICKGF